MNKTYLIPQMRIVAVQPQNIITVSGTGNLTTTGLDGIEYSNTSASGQSADVKANTVQWEDWQRR